MNGQEDERPGRTRSQTAAGRLALPAPFIARGRSRSPSPAVVGDNVFSFRDRVINSPNPYNAAVMGDIDVAELQRIAKSAADAAAAASAALTAMTAQLTASQHDNTRLRALKKPDLPNFDAKNIEIWLRRVDAAFIRAGVDSTKDKFAFLEAKFPVELDPRINNFLFGTITENTWTEFQNYLVKRFGRTKQQRVNTLIDGIERDGRRPSEVAALLCELTRDVTIEDIRKEQLLKMLPVDVKRALAKEPDTLTLEQLAEVADNYFDQQGRPKFTSPTSTINFVEEPLNATSNHGATPSGLTPAFSSPEEPVNAIQRPPSRAATKAPTGSRQPQGNSNGANVRPNQRPTNQSRTPTFDSDGNCFYHATYGVKADRCFDGCKHPAAHASGNGRGGRRK